jgi:hypothetical protein
MSSRARSGRLVEQFYPTRSDGLAPTKALARRLADQHGEVQLSHC